MQQSKQHVPRVDQVDANELDDEVFSIWKHQLTTIFKYFKPTILNSIEPELNAALRFVIWKISVKAFHATIGQQMLLMKYNSSLLDLKLHLYAVGIIGCHWLKDRADEINIAIGKSNRNVEWLRKVLDWGEIIVKLASFLNFMAFVCEGQYSTLIERVLRLKKVPSVAHGFRQLEYDYMAREMLWHGFSEFTTFLLPCVRWRNLKNHWNSLLRRETVSTSIPADHQRCSICQQPYCRPHVIGCEHIFCYYCIMRRFTVEDCTCPVCNREATVDHIQPYSRLHP